MVTIETEHGTYSGETMKEAQAEVRKGEREYAKRRKAEQADADVARLKATAVGYDMLVRIVEKEPMPHGFRLKDGRHKEFADAVGYDGGAQTIRLSLPGGMVTIRLYVERVTAIVENGAGWDFVLFKTEGPGEPVKGYAIGGQGNQWSIRPLPGLTPDMFRVMRERVPSLEPVG